MQRIFQIAPLWIACALPAFAQNPDSAPISEITDPAAAILRTRDSIDLRGSIVAPNSIHEPDGHGGRPHTVYGSAEYVHQHPLARGVLLRTGLSWNRMDFGGTQAPIPGALQGVAAVIGADLLLSEKFGFRIEARPGVYSDFEEVGWDDVDARALIAAEYRYSPNIRLIGGVRFTGMGEYPVLPIAGAAFQFTEKLSLDLIYPDIQFEYRLNEDWEWNMGISFISGSYRTHLSGLPDEDADLRDAIVNYFESRPNVGVVYRGFDGIDIFANAGVAMGRKFDYFRADRQVVIGGAPFFEMGLRARF